MGLILDNLWFWYFICILKFSVNRNLNNGYLRHRWVNISVVDHKYKYIVNITAVPMQCIVYVYVYARNNKATLNSQSLYLYPSIIISFYKYFSSRLFLKVLTWSCCISVSHAKDYPGSYYKTGKLTFLVQKVCLFCWDFNSYGTKLKWKRHCLLLYKNQF